MRAATRKRKYDETTLYLPILDLFSDQQLAFAEVPYFGKREDLVLASSSLNILHAIEIKLRDWQGALKQAAINQLFAHFSYAALPEARIRTLRPEQWDAFRRYHVGLISVGDTAIYCHTRCAERVFSRSALLSRQRTLGDHEQQKKAETTRSYHTCHCQPKAHLGILTPWGSREKKNYLSGEGMLTLAVPACWATSPLTMRSLCTEFIGSLQKPYFIDPITYIFARRPSALLRFVKDRKGHTKRDAAGKKQKGDMKRSFRKIVEAYGELITNVVQAGRPLEVSDFAKRPSRLRICHESR